MARRKIETEVETSAFDRLNDLVPAYYDDKQEQSRIKANVDAGNAEIKSCLELLGVDSIEINGLKATVSTQDRESFNEPMLIEVIKSLGDTHGIIKTREYVDMDALEDAIYKGLISEDMMLKMDSCKEHKYVTTLRVTKAKKKKEDE